MRRPAGFTLIELLVAMTLLATLGVLMIQLVRNSFDLYEEGDRRGDLYDRGLHVLNLLEDDLMAINGVPDGRFVLGTPEEGSAVSFFCRLIRSIPGGEEGHPVLRRAGTKAGGELTYAGDDPGPAARDDIVPPSGLMEVAYALVQEPADPPGILTLYRGERAPAMAAGSFFRGDVSSDEGWVRQNLRPVAGGILGLWVLCFGQESEDWAEEDVLDARGQAVSGGSLPVWDSTRGTFGEERFPLAVGPASRNDPRDDVFPRRVRIVLQVARPELPEAKLVSPLRNEGTQIEVTNTDKLPPEDAENRMVKVGFEWVRLASMGSGWAKVVRGKRGSGGNFNHPLGTPVFAGRLFRKTLELPVGRSHWGGSAR